MNLAGSDTHPEAAATLDKAGQLEHIFQGRQPELLGMLCSLLGSADDARDALQEAFLKCWRKRDDLGQVRNLQAWVYQVVLNTGRDRRTEAWRRRQSLADEMTVPTPAVAHVEVERREQVERVRRALRDLRPEEQEVFLLRQNGDLTYDQIGAALELPVGTVKTRMRLALAKLRQVLAES